MPNHERGYVHRERGLLPQDEEMGQNYRRNLTQVAVFFSDAMQRKLIDASLEACKCQHVCCHSIATESTHIHLLVSWNTERTWRTVRRQIGRNLSLRLNAKFGRKRWLSKSPSRKRVVDRPHLDHLMNAYFPNHSGWKWDATRGLYR